LGGKATCSGSLRGKAIFLPQKATELPEKQYFNGKFKPTFLSQYNKP